MNDDKTGRMLLERAEAFVAEVVRVDAICLQPRHFAAFAQSEVARLSPHHNGSVNRPTVLLPALDALARGACGCADCRGLPAVEAETCLRDGVLAVLQGLRACMVVEVRRLRAEAYSHDVGEASVGAMQHYSSALELADEALEWLGDDVSDLPDVDVEAAARRSAQ